MNVYEFSLDIAPPDDLVPLAQFESSRLNSALQQSIRELFGPDNLHDVQTIVSPVGAIVNVVVAVSPSRSDPEDEIRTGLAPLLRTGTFAGWRIVSTSALLRAHEGQSET